MSQTILITAGGTGGHIFPALAVARVLRAKGFEVVWMGSAGGMEESLVPKEFRLETIPIKGLRGKGMSSWLLAPWRLLNSTWQAWKVIQKVKPSCVLGFGGFVTGPTGVAAWISRIPLVLHEQNSIAGTTNRLLSRIANQVLQAFPHVFPPSVKAITVGNPVRSEIADLPLPVERFSERSGPLRLLVLGGSLGAEFLNQMVFELMQEWEGEKPEVWNQTGRSNAEALKAQYENCGIEVKITPFIENMAEAYAWADLVLARAGALTIAELTAAGVGSILVPFPYAIDNHQYYNAQYLERVSAVILMPQSSFELAKFKEHLQRFSKDRTLLMQMGDSARGLALPSATQEVVRYTVNQIQYPIK